MLDYAVKILNQNTDHGSLCWPKHYLSKTKSLENIWFSNVAFLKSSSHRIYTFLNPCVLFPRTSINDMLKI